MGRVLADAGLSIPERFQRRVAQLGADECWPWVGAVQDGYGMFSITGIGRVGAHRYAYVLAKGGIPEGMTIDHTCHTSDTRCPGGKRCLHRRCCNPRHLEVVTNEENARRGVVRMHMHQARLDHALLA